MNHNRCTTTIERSGATVSIQIVFATEQEAAAEFDDVISNLLDGGSTEIQLQGRKHG